MKQLLFIRDIILNFVFVFVIYVIVTYLYNQIAHGTTEIHWEEVLKYTVIFGIILTAVKLFGNKKNQDKTGDD
jgi:hypothetical protein